MRIWVLLPLLIVASSHAAQNRLILFDQSDFGARKGLYLDFENNFPDGQVGHLDTLSVFFVVGDGKSITILKADPKLKVGDVLHLKAEVSADRAKLWVNEAQIGEQAVVLAPIDAVKATAAQTPAWAASPVDYRLVEKNLVVNGKRYDFSEVLARPLSMFEVPLPVSIPFRYPADRRLTLEATVKVEPVLSLRSEAPFIDRYGQAIHADWPGKVRSDRQLRADRASEKMITASWKRPAGWDPYGGAKDAGWKAKGTGYYRTLKRSGVWWLVSPDGNPLFYTGLCTAPSVDWDRTPVTGREFLWKDPFPKDADLWTLSDWGAGADIRSFAQHSYNLKRELGTDWKVKAKIQCAERLRRWGFTGLGKWSEGLPNTPWMPVLGLEGVERVGRHPDVFDPKVRAQIEASLRTQITPHLHDPWVLGWSIGNEYDEVITRDEVLAAMRLPDSVPLKKVLVSELHGMPLTDEAQETLRRHYAKAYYRTLYETVKRIDPNHLYFGFWIVPGWWVNDADWDVSQPYCDVIGFDRYAEGWSGIEDLLRRQDKPVLLGEFSFPAWYEGKRGFGRYGVFRQSDHESGESYAKLVGDAAKDPRCVGAMWFQYRDQPLTGRGPGRGESLVLGEHYAFGFVDATNRPKWDLVKRARAVNLAATKLRLTASPTSDPERR